MRALISRQPNRQGLLFLLTGLPLHVWNNVGNLRRMSLLTSELRRITPDLVARGEVIQTPEYNQLEELLDGPGLFGTTDSTWWRRPRRGSIATEEAPSPLGGRIGSPK